MNINDMIDAGITIEGEIEIRKCDNEDGSVIVIHGGYADELDENEWYMDKEISYMFAYKNDYSTVLCFELAN